MANIDNLVKNSDLTPQERQERARKAGKASAKARREKKEMRERTNDILKMSMMEGKLEDFKTIQGAAGKNLTVQDQILLAQVRKALKGDTRAAEWIRDTAGMKPTDKREITATVTESPLNSILAQLTETAEDK